MMVMFDTAYAWYRWESDKTRKNCVCRLKRKHDYIGRGWWFDSIWHLIFFFKCGWVLHRRLRLIRTVGTVFHAMQDDAGVLEFQRTKLFADFDAKVSLGLEGMPCSLWHLEGISQPEFVMGTYQVDIFIDAASKMSWGTALRRSDVRPKLPGEWNLKLML